MNHLIENPILLKAALLCYGLKKNEDSSELFSLFNPYNTKRTGNVGIHLKIDNHVVNTILYDSDRKNNITPSPFELKKCVEQNSISWVLFENGKVIRAIELIEPPKWYNKKTSNNHFMGEIFLSEGDSNLMGSIGGSCQYFKTSQQCHFCGYQSSGLQYSPKDLSEVVNEAYKFNKNITVTITSGNTFTEDRGIVNYFPYIEAIRDLNVSIPLQIECSPPKMMSYLDQAIDKGVNSFSINFELFADEMRKEIIPAKNTISTENYIQAWRHIQAKLGCGRVSSAIIFGIESSENTLMGARWLISQGVRPNVIPFKPILGAKLQNKNVPNYHKYYEICAEIAAEIRKSKLDISQRLGCSSCGGCNLEGDYEILNY